jgi:hypothetical protein
MPAVVWGSQENLRSWQLVSGPTFESESCTTDGQSASLSWNKAPIWGLRPEFYYCQRFTDFFMRAALSGERTDLAFKFVAGPRQCSLFGSESRRTRDHILLSQTGDFPFRRLLRLAGLRRRYSTPPTHGVFYIWVRELPNYLFRRNVMCQLRDMRFSQR